MRISLSQLLTLLFVALAFVTGCNPPSNPTCSSYIGQATINEVSKVGTATSEDANDFVEVKIINTALTASTLNNWNVLICKKGASTCYGGALSSATITTATDGSGARYYVIKSLTNVGRYINFSVGTEVALSDQNDYAVDYLSIASYADHKPSCTFSYGTTASTSATTRRIRRNADGTGNWEVVNANDQPATEGLNNTTMPPIAAEWRMEQASWNGTSGEVVATTSSLNGTAKNSATTANASPGPAVATTPGSCRYGKFTSSGTANQYVTIPDDDILDFSTSSSGFTAMSFSAWINPKTATTQGTIISKGLVTSATASDYMYSLRLFNSTRLDFSFCSATTSGNCSTYNTVSATSATSLLNTWTHVVVSFHSGYQKIYLNGVEASISSNSVIGVPLTNARPLFIGNTPNSATSPTAYSYPFDGAIDEARFYRAALTQSQAQSVMNEVHSCGNHVAISHSGTASTCKSINVTFNIHNASHAPLTGTTGALAISTSTGRGTWSKISGTGAFSAAANDGQATYTLVSGESSFVLTLRHDQAGSVNINVSGALSEDSSDDPSITFSNAAFLIRTSTGAAIPTQISGKNSNTGWNGSTVQIEAVATDPDSGACVGVLADGAQDVKFGYECLTPSTCAGSDLLTVNGTTVTRNNATSTINYATVSLSFSNSIALLPLNYSDAGNIKLYASKALTDGSNITLAGSASFSARPFALRFNAISGNTNGTASAGNGFIAAGATFPLTLDAIAYDGIDTMDGNGYPVATAVLTNNAVTPSFALASVPLTINSFTPAGGAAGSLSASSASFSSGSASLSDVTYSEVGSIKLRAAASNYLGNLSVQGDSPDIGRFYPQNFVLVSSSVTQACPSPTTSTPFTYMGQPFSLSYQLEARNASVPSAITRNYDTTAGYTTASITPVAENADNGTSLVSRLTVNAGVGRWDDGIYVPADGASNFTVSNAVFARNTSGADGPFGSLQLGIVLTDADSRNMTSLNMNATTAGNCSPSCTAKAIGLPMNMRYGRLALRDATGSDRASAIIIPALAEYYSGSQFVRNEDDSCTAYGFGGTQINDVDFSGSTALLASYTDTRGTNAGQWWLPAAGSSMKLSAGLFGNYPNALSIKPVVGVTGPGPLGVSLNSTSVPPWLQFKWDGTNETGPSCKLTLGQTRGNDRVVFWRERH